MKLAHYWKFRASGVSAHQAMIWASHMAHNAEKANALHFSWENCGDDCFTAHWRQDDLDLQATIQPNESGWKDVGEDNIGIFLLRHTDGAIKHTWDDGGAEWFLPANSHSGAKAKSDLKRAIGYGKDWRYLKLSVTANQNGVPIGFAETLGIVSDRTTTEERTEEALSLADEAIEEAQSYLERQRASH